MTDFVQVPLQSLVSEVRDTANPATVHGDEVFHYSIPALDEHGDGVLESIQDIGSNKLQLRGGEVLISKLNPRISRVLIARSHDVPTLASTEFIALVPGPDIDPRFLCYWLRAETIRQLLDAATLSVTRSQQRVRPKVLTGSWIALPRRSVQRNIADYLDRETARIDSLIAAKQRMVELLEERLWSEVSCRIERHAQSFLPLRRFITRITDGPFGSSLTSSDYTAAGARVVRLGNIGRGYFRNEDEAFIGPEYFQSLLRHRVLPGDLLIAGLGDANNPVGRACVAPDLGSAIVKADCYCASVNPERSRPDFLALYLSSPLGAKNVAMAARGTTRSRINLDIAREIDVPDLSLPTQGEITAVATEQRRCCDELSRKLESQTTLLQERRQALVTAAVMGQLDIPEAA